MDLKHPIVEVEILNPFSYQEFSGSKQIVLDVRCRDSVGRRINVEMQVAAFAGLIERLVYYACSMYVDQLTAGDDYTSIAPSISICLLNYRVFQDTEQAHHRFQMLDAASGRTLDKAIEVHTVELTKYNLDRETIRSASPLHQWVFLLLYAQEFDGNELERLLPGIDFKTAIETLESISGKTKDKQMYDQRERARLDYERGISGARNQGRMEGRTEGRTEALADTVRLLQDLLGEPTTALDQLLAQSPDALATTVAQLQQRLRDRPS